MNIYEYQERFGKNFHCFFFFGVICLLVLSSFEFARAESVAPRATFERMWVDYDVMEGNQNGMRIHVKFTAYELKNTDCQLGIYFQDENGNPLKDKNKRLYTTKGNVAVFKDLKPGHAATVYNDLTVFMPYDELDLGDGSYNLKMDVDLIYEDGELIQHLTAYNFNYRQNYNKPGNKNPTGKVDRVWVDYDVTENGQFGMRIHVKFTAANMKGIDSYLAIYFEKESGERLTSSDSRFQSKAGDVAAYRSLKPGYDQTEYNDLTVFMPYSELHLGVGNHNLKMDIDLIQENGTFIDHLYFHVFSYWKK
jgi:hypothetical protein